MKYTPAQYNKIFLKLPQEIKDVVVAQKTSEIIWKIGEKHRLHLDQIGAMNDLVLDTMMGIIPSKNLENEISENCQISKTDTALIIRDIDEEVFKPIKELMVKIYAGGAPYKPDTMLTVDEKDDDHSHLDRNDILKEIEDPVETEKKVAPMKTVSPAPKKKLPPIKISDSKVLEEYHEEIAPKEKSVPQDDLRSKAPTGISSVEESKKRLLESIASKKLDGIFTMPKVDLREGSLPPKPIEKKESFSQNNFENKNIPSNKDASAPINTNPQQDPYRESIK